MTTRTTIGSAVGDPNDENGLKGIHAMLPELILSFCDYLDDQSVARFGRSSKHFWNFLQVHLYKRTALAHKAAVKHGEPLPRLDKTPNVIWVAIASKWRHDSLDLAIHISQTIFPPLIDGLDGHNLEMDWSPRQLQLPGTECPPMFLAVQDQNLDLVKKLVDSGADPNIHYGGYESFCCDHAGFSGTQTQAIVHQRSECPLKGDPHHRGCKTALDLAAISGFAELALDLLDLEQIVVEPAALYSACANRLPTVVQKMIESKSLANSDDLQTILDRALHHSAAWGTSTETIDVLLAAGANLHLPLGKKPRSPLQHAVKHKNGTNAIHMFNKYAEQDLLRPKHLSMLLSKSVLTDKLLKLTKAIFAKVDDITAQHATDYFHHRKLRRRICENAFATALYHHPDFASQTQDPGRIAIVGKNDDGLEITIKKVPVETIKYFLANHIHISPAALTYLVLRRRDAWDFQKIEWLKKAGLDIDVNYRGKDTNQTVLEIALEDLAQYMYLNLSPSQEDPHHTKAELHVCHLLRLYADIRLLSKDAHHHLHSFLKSRSQVQLDELHSYNHLLRNVMKPASERLYRDIPWL